MIVDPGRAIRAAICSRPEVSDRANGTGYGPPTNVSSPPERHAEDESKSPMTLASLFNDLDQSFALWITRRTNGGISQLSVETRDNRIVIRGSARSLCARQTAQATVQERFSIPAMVSGDARWSTSLTLATTKLRDSATFAWTLVRFAPTTEKCAAGSENAGGMDLRS